MNRLRGDTGARALLAAEDGRVAGIELEAAALDVDRPADLRRACCACALS